MTESYGAICQSATKVEPFCAQTNDEFSVAPAGRCEAPDGLQEAIGIQHHLSAVTEIARRPDSCRLHSAANLANRESEEVGALRVDSTHAKTDRKDL